MLKDLNKAINLLKQIGADFDENGDLQVDDSNAFKSIFREYESIETKINDNYTVYTLYAYLGDTKVYTYVVHVKEFTFDLF